MKTKKRNYRAALLGGMAVLLMIMLSACQTDLGLDGDKTFACDEDSECMDGWECAPSGVCVEEGSTLTPNDVGRDADPRDVDEQDADGRDVEQIDAAPDVDDICARCEQEGLFCDADQAECVECLESSNCDDSMMCESGSCVPAGCQQEGDRCNPDSTGDQGELVCARIAQRGGICVRRCYSAGTRSNCGSRAFCVPVPSGMNVCVPDQCQSGDSICNDGDFCLPLAEDVGLCRTPGEGEAGDPCGAEDSGCVAEFACRTGGARQNTLECVQRCTPWEPGSCRGTGQACKPENSVIGICQASYEVALRPMEECEMAGIMCGDAVECRVHPVRLSGTNVCVPSCREHGECDRWSTDQEFLCNKDLEPGRKDLGFCAPACENAEDCVTSEGRAVCVEKQCRFECTSAADCPSRAGGPNRQWTCTPEGYCE